jgi:phosphate transport system protein
VSHYEETLERDIHRISEKVTEMGALAVAASRRCIQALSEKNPQIAYSVILRDQHIDELEKELDRLCLEFIVRQQPVGRTLRFVYATIKVSSELERVGDYAESMARHILDLTAQDVGTPSIEFTEIAERAVGMLSDSVQAFVKQDEDVAKRTIAADAEVNRLRHELSGKLLQLETEKKLPLEALFPLMTVVNRFERVADQAKSICQEALYIRTGEYVKHPGGEVIRVLFVDRTNASLSQVAEAVGNSLALSRFMFTSAGLARESVDPGAVAFLKEKGLDVAHVIAKSVEQVPYLDHYQVIVGLAPEARRAFPPPPTKSVCLEWNLVDPRTVQGGPENVHAAYEAAYRYLQRQIADLANAILGDTTG